ncbi:hypothetical protein CHLRE_09g403500v5 [Chlamydomonas reinhardtii]|uniref:RING-type domain-containing protein n=1 Tax=Chlamydomonas reinhardtii TaxID=3055 RepID=A0A2K3DCN6_CHLRE|nr:uncharacterized protein CHLRE_09g403500v5 [Chlamydomonas reinhardtii]PNW78288.1 hypothetical protein CHLRE_09g403500v5 [Chlamydomonas reinhardtii]
MGSSHSCMVGAASPAAQLSRSLQAGDEHSLLLQLAEKPALLSKPTCGGGSGGLGGSLAAQLLPWTAAHHGLTPLHLACENKQIKAVEQMLSFLDSSPLEVVRAALAPYCRRAGLPLPDSPAEGVRLAAGMANCKGQTPLMYACYAGCPELVRLLLERGADPWAGDRCGQRTALHYAAMSGSAGCIAALMAHTPPHMLNRPLPRPGSTGASAGCRYVDARSLCGLTPLHYAAYFACDPPTTTIGANSRPGSVSGSAPVSTTVTADALAALRELLRHEPSLNAVSTSESYDMVLTCAAASTPLHMAAVRGNLGAARDILHHYALRSASTTGHWVADPRTRADAARQFPWQVASAYHPSKPKLSALLHPGRSVEAALLWLTEVEEEAAAERSRAAREAAQEQHIGGRRSIRRQRELQEEQHATVMQQVSRSTAAAAAAARPSAAASGGAEDSSVHGRVYAPLVLGGVGGIGPAPLAAIAAAALRSRLLHDLHRLESEEPLQTNLPHQVQVEEAVAAAEDAEEEDEDALCGVCFAEPKQVAPTSCGHGLCRGCAAALSRGLAAASGKDGRKPVLCPFCRRGVAGFTAYAAPTAAAAPNERSVRALVAQSSRVT